MGGKASRHGGCVRDGQLFRGEAIAKADGEDAALLASLGIRLVCDLRSSRERSRAPSHWLETGVEVLALDVNADFRASDDSVAALRADPGEAGAVELMAATYRQLPAACARHLGLLFRRLGAGDHPVLLHCTAGKDRTGFFSAMILTALGVHEDDVMADYLESVNRRNAAVIDATRELMAHHFGGPVPEEALAALNGARREYLAASFATIVREHGSIDAYLAGAVGLDPAGRARLIERLVA